MEERIEYHKEREKRGKEGERRRGRERELAFPPFLSWVLSVLMLIFDLGKWINQWEREDNMNKRKWRIAAELQTCLFSAVDLELSEWLSLT